jgi:NAD(P)-dependent dehydrogenase (short-subunit alcohol dehydrogenase family)
MELKDKIIVVTGAASGIGKALAIRFAAEDARKVVCVDLNLDGAQATADQIGGVAYGVNVGVEAEIAQLIETVEADIGPIDLFCSNAGILVAGGVEASDDDWQRIWDINVMSHVWAARGHARRWLPSQHRVGGGSAQSGGIGALRRDQTRRCRSGRMAGADLRGSGHQGFGAMSAGRAQRNDARPRGRGGGAGRYA